jgi:sporulation protein YlmC with PRC-barrel domain
MFKKLMVTTALSGVMIGAALAQSSAPPPSSDSKMMKPSVTTTAPAPSSSAIAPTPSGSAQFVNSQKPDQYLASKFKGTDVVGTDDKKIGDVTDILFDKDGKIEAYVVSVGGFLGMGTKDVALAPTSFQVVSGDKSKNESDKLRLSMTQDQLKQAANFEPYKAPSTTTGSAIRPSSTRPAPMAPPPASK